MITESQAPPKKTLSKQIQVTVRFLNRCNGIIGSFANFHSIRANIGIKKNPTMRQAKTGAELHEYFTPPRLRATKIKVANASRAIVPKIKMCLR
jgi:hypothetical protein